MKKILLTVILYLSLSNAFAYDILQPVGGRAAAMGGTAVASRGLWALQNNPAGMANLDQFSFGLYYENHWMLKETAFKSAALAIPVKFGCLGVSFNQFGSSKYSENKFGLAYAKDFGPYLQIGLQLDYLMLSIGNDYDKQSAVTFELGIQSQVTEKLRLGTYIFNPVHIALQQSINQEKLPIVFRFGAAYQFTKDFVGQCEIEKNTDYEGVSLRGGLEYEALKDFYLRAGVQTNPGLLSFGLGYEIRFARIDVAAQLHEILGNTIQVGMVFSIGKQK
ncbi:MAG: hypothetical protein IKZ55_01400 [Bacteroidales bacterium]|nr:hypothetical protein [Bacteroidales bacterium]